jgi:hypothetical protein
LPKSSKNILKTQHKILGQFVVTLHVNDSASNIIRHFFPMATCSDMVNMDQGSDKGGGVVQMVLVDTKRNAYA